MENNNLKQLYNTMGVNNRQELVDIAYPIGSTIIVDVNIDFNPFEYYGGKWRQIGHELFIDRIIWQRIK